MQRKNRVTITKALIIQVNENIKNAKRFTVISRTSFLSYLAVRMIQKHSQYGNHIENFVMTIKEGQGGQ